MECFTFVAYLQNPHVYFLLYDINLSLFCRHPLYFFVTREVSPFRRDCSQLWQNTPFFEAISEWCEQRVALMGTYKEKLQKLSQIPKEKKSWNSKTIRVIVVAHQGFKNFICVFVSSREIGLKFLDLLHFWSVRAHVYSQLFILSEIRIWYKSLAIWLWMWAARVETQT